MSHKLICVWLALLCFVLSALGIPSRINLESAGLALLVVAWMI